MKNTMTRLLALLLCVLTLCVSLALVSCDLPLLKNEVTKTEAPATGTTAPETDTEAATEARVSFTLTVTFGDGSTKDYTVATDKDNVGDALLAEGIVAGDVGEYGLYIKTVAGVTADWDKDQTYWGLYVNGDYSMVGISGVKVTEGLRVELKLEKGM